VADPEGFVRVENVTRGTVVGDRIRLARSMKDRTVGLLGRSGLDAGEGLWIERSPSIHMFFMRFAIDAVFIADGGRVTQIAANLKPWRVVWWARGARDCLELPAGAAAATGTEVGDTLRHTRTDTKRPAPEGSGTGLDGES
jgi:uncharacterized membrane protein (UPF0127 family)